MKISVVAFEGCMTSAVFGLMDTFAIATIGSGSVTDQRWSGHTAQIVTSGGQPVRGFGAHAISSFQSLEDASDSDVVIVPPIFGDVEMVLDRERELVDWLRGFRTRESIVASACSGAFLLAEAGFGGGQVMTTNPAFKAFFSKRYPGIKLALDKRIVDSPTLICAGSTTSFFDLAVHVVGRLGGHELAVLTAKTLSINRNPSSQLAYSVFVAPKDHGDNSILHLQDWLENNYARSVTLEDMAREGAMSLRNLNRRFHAATAHSPVQYLRAVRIEFAKRLLESDRESVERIASEVGYQDTRAFIRAFVATVGISPGAYRRRFCLQETED
jgi:transcriptional regulator GlxA family with amidase domain